MRVPFTNQFELYRMCIVYEFYLFDFTLCVLNLLFRICINQQIKMLNVDERKPNKRIEFMK